MSSSPCIPVVAVLSLTRARRSVDGVSGRGRVRAGHLVARRAGHSRAANRRAGHFWLDSPTSRRRPGSPHPVIYGGVDAKSYIVEVVGCGVAFLDYDNDGWLDVFLLSGTG